MDIQTEEGGTRKRRRRRGRRTRVVNDSEGVSVEKDQTGSSSGSSCPPVVFVSQTQTQQQPAHSVVKRLQKPVAAPATVAATAATTAAAPAPKPQVILAPPKKKPAKLVLVPKGVGAPKVVAKTFKARRVSVTIDNTAKTQKRRRQLRQSVEVMTPEQLRAAAVAAKLSRKETVEKVPVELLRQMLKDYYTMRGMLL